MKPAATFEEPLTTLRAPGLAAPCPGEDPVSSVGALCADEDAVSSVGLPSSGGDRARDIRCARRTKKARGAPYEGGAPLPDLTSLPPPARLFPHAPLFPRTLLGAPTVAIALLAASLLTACGDEAKPAPDAGAPAKSASAAAPAKSTAAPAKAPAPPADGVELLKFQLTTGVKDKDPVDKLDSTKPGQRVYGHLTVRNRTAGPQRVSLSFRVNDDERAMVDLTVEKSWSWRTWAYVTLRKDDKGELTVHAFDDHGAELGTASIPIK